MVLSRASRCPSATRRLCPRRLATTAGSPPAAPRPLAFPWLLQLLPFLPAGPPGPSSPNPTKVDFHILSYLRNPDSTTTWASGAPNGLSAYVPVWEGIGVGPGNNWPFPLPRFPGSDASLEQGPGLPACGLPSPQGSSPPARARHLTPPREPRSLGTDRLASSYSEVLAICGWPGPPPTLAHFPSLASCPWESWPSSQYCAAPPAAGPGDHCSPRPPPLLDRQLVSGTWGPAGASPGWAHHPLCISAHDQLPTFLRGPPAMRSPLQALVCGLYVNLCRKLFHPHVHLSLSLGFCTWACW